MMKAIPDKVDVIHLSETGVTRGIVTNGSKMTTNVWSPTAVSSGNRCYRFWAARSTNEKLYLFIIGFLFVFTVIFASLTGFYVDEYKKSEEFKDRLCLDIECVRSAATIIERMDFSRDPCENFYDFSCGNFLKTKAVPDDHASRNILQEIQDEIFVEMKHHLEESAEDSPEIVQNLTSIKNAKLFYNSCMNETTADDETQAVKIMSELIESSGGKWIILETLKDKKGIVKKLSNNRNLEKRVASSFIDQVQSIFHFYVAPPEKNSTRYALHLFNGNTVLEYQYLLNATTSPSDQQYQQYTTAYTELQVEVLRLMFDPEKPKEHSLFTTEVLEEVRSQILQMFAFEADLANLTKINSDNASEEEGLMGNSSEEGSSSSSSAEQKGPQLSQQNHQMVKLNVSELEKEFGFLKWSKVFNYLEEQTSIRITEILTDSKDYLNEVSQLFARHSLQTIDNYFCWAYVARFLPYLGPQFRRLYTDFRREMPDLTGSTNDPRSEGGRVFLSRWKECVHLTCEGLKLPSSLLYLSHHEGFMQEANRSVSLMIRNIKNAFHHIIRSQKWLKSEVIQRMLIEKAEAIGSKIGFPSFLSSDPKTADSLFSGLEIESSDVFVSNIIKIARNEMRMELRKMNQTIDPDKDWLIQPLVSNAYFDAINDFIILPAGILRYPLVGTNRPKFLDYATLGVVIGHEIAHSFDTLTRKESDNDYENVTWWPATLQSEYESLTKCFSDLFSSYQIKSTGEYLNGNATLDENLCDFAGFQQAFTAYKSLDLKSEKSLPGLTQFSSDQLFFIQYAQVWCEVSNEEGDRRSVMDNHSPGRFRTMGVVVNSPQFSQVFKCKQGSPMNPEAKCSLWTPSDHI